MKVAFLWHMHQPCYRDALTDEVALPWVRLHACQSYLDMADVLRGFDNVRVSFNLVPSLIQQLKEYSEKGFEGDVFYDLSMQDPADLSEDDAIFVLRNFFSINWETDIKPYHGYARLLERRGFKHDPESLAQSLKEFSKQDMFDLQVWFNLAWFGFTAKRMFPEIADIQKKGRDFTLEDKEAIFARQLDIVKMIIPIYTELWAEGRIEVITSPFYHPILPLLMSTDIARRAMPGVHLPPRFSAPADARAQLENAKNYVSKELGKEPVGLWPSEGAVCPELIPLLDEVEFRYFVTDQKILQLSCSGERECSLYQPYRVEIDGKGCAAFFREHGISDAIGFTYSKNPPELAALDFMGRLEKTASKAGDIKEPVVVIALDGENPWEYYPDQGEGFLTRVYAELDKRGAFETVRLGDYLERNRPVERLSSIHSGSWIDASFRIWIGHPEENKAWDLLNRTRTFVQSWAGKRGADPECVAQAMDQIYRAEGSDWFWWFGEDFTVIQDTVFDQLFRKHLENAYKLCGEEVPDVFNEPIKAKPTVLIFPPLAFIHPTIDGLNTDFYEWEQAGYYDAFRTRGSMHVSHSLLSGLHFGFDRENLYIRLDLLGELAENPGAYWFKVDFSEPVLNDIIFRLGGKGRFVADVVERKADDLEKVGELTECAYNRIVEMKIPFDVLGVRVGDLVKFVVRIFSGEIEADRHPKSGLISFNVPDEDFENMMWSV